MVLDFCSENIFPFFCSVKKRRRGFCIGGPSERWSWGTLRGEERPNEGCLDLACLGHSVASFLEQRGDPGAGCPFEEAPAAQHPTTAEEYAATEEDTAFDVMDGDEEGYSS